MAPEKDYISASEVNKFTYCPYQWYYEKKWGTKALRQMAAERNKELGIESQTAGNFKRGLRYHNRYHKKLLFRQRCVKAAAFLLALALVYGLYLWYTGGFYG